MSHQNKTSDRELNQKSKNNNFLSQQIGSSNICDNRRGQDLSFTKIWRKKWVKSNTLMTISHLQIAVFLNSHPGSAFGRPVVMAGLRPAMTMGGLDKYRGSLKKVQLRLDLVNVVVRPILFTNSSLNKEQNMKKGARFYSLNRVFH